MQKPIYLTTNKWKIREAKLIFNEKYRFDFDIITPDFEIYEIQAETCAEVAKFSVKYAAEKLNQPCLKSDTGLYIDALGGLPGPYNHYFDVQIGDKKFLELLKNETNRKARIEHSFAYCEPGKEPIIFSASQTGTIATELRGTNGHWHDFFFIPDGETRTLAEIGDVDLPLKTSYYGDAIEQFAKWYSSQK